MYQVECAEIWGGTANQDEDVCSAGIYASLFSSACDGSQGGDIYYLSVCESDRLTRVAIADVTGHGPKVSEVSQWLYEVLEAHMNDTDCDEVLAELNRSAMRHGIRAMTTATVIGFYTADSNLYYAYAGHGPVLLQRNGAVDWRPIELDAASTLHSNAPLGVLSDTYFDQQRISLVCGDRLFLHTDGLTEAMNVDGELFGQHRLTQALVEAGDRPLPDLKRSVLEAVARHTSGMSARDDLTLLAIEVR